MGRTPALPECYLQCFVLKCSAGVARNEGQHQQHSTTTALDQPNTSERAVERGCEGVQCTGAVARALAGGGMRPGFTRARWAAGGLALHAALLVAVFDIYFRSPVVRGVPSYTPHHTPPARRLLLISADGLRAEAFLQHERTPFLRSVASKRGLWGISSTRVPTESRPGHVAIIAGFYEDPSAVAKGWKKNPVDFDSVFNQSRYTWSWGVDDILHIFSKGINDGHIFTYAYSTDDQTFSTDKNTTLLDAWVFDRVRIFFQKAKSDNGLMKKLHQDKIVFFLHLLGLDTSGHTNKPNSPDYVTNMKFVDEGISQMEQIVEEFYDHDNQTTYIMTSDHGMTDWGSHGSGGKHETETPYVLWGAGVAQYISCSSEELVYGLPISRRRDISQADIAPLMSTIISIPVPVNSVGRLPEDLLNMTLENKAKAVYSNSRQLAAQYNTMRLQVEENAIPWIYYPFQPFDKNKLEEIINFTEKLMEDGEFEKLILLSEEIINLSLSGLTYYHNYYQTILLAFVTMSFCGWIAYLLTMLLEQKRSTNVGIEKSKMFPSTSDRANSIENKKLNLSFALLSTVLAILIYVQRLPIQYYVYSLVPIFLWWRVLSSANVWMLTLREINMHNNILKLFVQIVCYIIGTVALVWSFAERWWLSVPLLGMALWPFVSAERRHLTWTLLLYWAASCLLLGVFSFLPVVGKEVHVALVIFAGIIWLIISSVLLQKLLLPMCHVGLETKKEVFVTAGQMVLLLLALHNIYTQSKRFADSAPVVPGHQLLAWLIAGTSLVMPLFSTTRQVCRLLIISISLLTFYLLLSVSHEGLFLVTLMLNQFCWLLIEFQLSHSINLELTEFSFTSKDDSKQKRQSLMKIERSLTEHDFRRAFFFLLYIILSFFGTGNIASINSFEVRWVTCFVTTFRPFLITALILCKTMVPFLIVACTFRAISILTKAPTGYLIVIVLIFSDMMGVQFLHYVKNTGSWLEIGTSISQYVIAQVITLFIVLLHIVAKVMTEINLSSVVESVFNSRKKYV